MKNILLTFIILGSFSNVTYTQIVEEQFNFSIRCNVLDTIVLRMEGGLSKRYSGATNHPMRGDAFNIDFEFERTGNLLKLTIDIDDLFLSAHLDSKKGHFSEENELIYLRGFLDLPWHDTQLRFSENSIDLRDPFASVYINRYFKNDWELIYSSGGDGNFLLTANCKNMPEEFDKMHESFYELLSE